MEPACPGGMWRAAEDNEVLDFDGSPENQHLFEALAVVAHGPRGLRRALGC